MNHFTLNLSLLSFYIAYFETHETVHYRQLLSQFSKLFGINCVIVLQLLCQCFHYCYCVTPLQCYCVVVYIQVPVRLFYCVSVSIPVTVLLYNCVSVSIPELLPDCPMLCCSCVTVSGPCPLNNTGLNWIKEMSIFHQFCFICLLLQRALSQYIYIYVCLQM